MTQCLSDEQIKQITESAMMKKICQLSGRIAELEILNDILRDDLAKEKAKHETVRI